MSYPPGPAPGHRSAICEISLREIGICAMAAALLASPAIAQQSQKSPTASAADSAQVGATAPEHHSRFGRLGRIGKAVGIAADVVSSRTGISKATAARIAVTAATGGAAALMTGQAAAATAAKRAAPASLGAQTLAGVALPSAQAALERSMQAAPATLPGQVNDPEALQALMDLSRISSQAAQGNPGARRAMDALNTAMARPPADLAALEKRANGGDAAAAQQIVIREDRIARAALTSGHP